MILNPISAHVSAFVMEDLAAIRNAFIQIPEHNRTEFLLKPTAAMGAVRVEHFRSDTSTTNLILGQACP